MAFLINLLAKASISVVNQPFFENDMTSSRVSDVLSTMMNWLIGSTGLYANEIGMKTMPVFLLMSERSKLRSAMKCSKFFFIKFSTRISWFA